MFRVQKYHEGALVEPIESEATREARNKRPPGLYKCPECRDATIVWRTTVDKYKVNCPKCSTEMKHVALVPKPIVTPVATAIPILVKMSTAEEVAEQYDMLTQTERKMLLKQIRERRSPRLISRRSKLALAGTGLVAAGLAMRRQQKRTVETVKKNELDILAEIYANDPQRSRLDASQAGVPMSTVICHYGKKTGVTGLQLGMKHGQEESAGTRGSPGALKLWLLQKMHGGSYVIGRQKGLSGKHGGTRSGASILEDLPALLKGIVHGTSTQT